MAEKTEAEQIVSLEAILKRYGYDVPVTGRTDTTRLDELRVTTRKVSEAADRAFAAGAKDSTAVLTRIHTDEPAPGVDIAPTKQIEAVR